MIKIDPKILQQAVKDCGAFVWRGDSPYATITITSDVNTVSISASNGDMSIHTILDAEVVEPLCVSVNGAKLKSLVGTLNKSGQVTISISGRSLIVEQKGRYKLPTLSFNKNTPLSLPQEHTAVSIDTVSFVDGLALVLPCCANEKDTMQPWQLSVSVSIKDNYLFMMGGTGKLFCRFVTPVDGQESVSGILLPKALCIALQSIVGGSDVISLRVSDRLAEVAFNSTIITSKLISGEFPDASKLLHTNESSYIDINAVELTSTIRRVTSVNDIQERELVIDADGEGVLLSSKNTSYERIDVDMVGDNFLVFVNSEQALIAIKPMGGKCRIFPPEESNPQRVLIRNIDDDRVDYAMAKMTQRENYGKI